MSGGRTGASRPVSSEGSDLDLIVIAGAGSGKSTLCRELQRRLDSPFIEFSSLRQPHLDASWSNASVTGETRVEADGLTVEELSEVALACTT